MDDTCWEVYGGYLKQRRDAGASLKEIGDEVGRTKQRIHKILVKHYGTADSEGTLSREDGGRAAKKLEYYNRL